MSILTAFFVYFVVWWLTLSVLLVALVATVSRGPWVGGVAMALVFAGIGKGAAKRFMRIGAGVAVASGLASMSEWGRGMIDYLPFIGTVGSETVEYRQRLFEVSMNILSHSPFFGEPGFYSNAAAQELRHEGIIDMVNSYLGIAVGTGLVGFGLFIGLFIYAIVLVWRARKSSEREPQTGEAARALLAVIAGILVTIGTTSSIGVIPPIYFAIAGLAVGYCGEFLAYGPVKGVSIGGDPGSFEERARARPLPVNAR